MFACLDQCRDVRNNPLYGNKHGDIWATQDIMTNGLFQVDKNEVYLMSVDIVIPRYYSK